MPTEALIPIMGRLVELVAVDGRTQNDIAKSAHMSPQQLSNIIHGERVAPSIVTIGRVLVALGKTWKDLDPTS